MFHFQPRPEALTITHIFSIKIDVKTHKFRLDDDASGIALSFACR
jgi:hypothetical protein